jgi:ABC-2 type transport system permease protein
MSRLHLLFKPRILGLKNRLIHRGSGACKRLFIMIALGLGFWGLMFFLSFRVLKYFQRTEVIGDVLAHHLLAMLLLTFFSLLVFSNIIAALSNLYVSRDLELCHAFPVHLEKIFMSRFVFTIMDSSWMVIVFGLPVMMAYAFIYRPGSAYYLSLLHMSLALAVIAAGISILLTMIMVCIFPAHRTRDILVLLMIVGVAALYLMFRLLRPERLVDPDAFFSIMHYVGSLKAPDSPYMPTRWVTETLWDHLSGSKTVGRLFEALLLWSTALAMVVINIWVAGAIYFTGFSKSQEAKQRRPEGRKVLDSFVKATTKPLRHDLASLMAKDIRLFFRDNTQWSQLFLLGALVVVYVYNFSVLPLERSPVRLEFLQNEIAFLNMGLAGFVLSAVAARFIFPAVSSEGEAFWIIRSSPLSVGRFLWGKYALYLVPMLLMGEVLIIATNYLLHVTPFMMFLSSATMFLLVFGIVALGIGFGALYPNFRYENIAQVATGYGALMYMIFSSLFIAVVIILEAGPVYVIFMTGMRGVAITPSQWLFIGPSFLAVLVINVLAVFSPMKMGLKALVQYE